MLILTQHPGRWIVIDTPVGQLRIQVRRAKEGSNPRVAIEGDPNVFKVSRVKETDIATQTATKR